jgi:hypothetical protein
MKQKPKRRKKKHTSATKKRLKKDYTKLQDWRKNKPWMMGTSCERHTYIQPKGSDKIVEI